MPGIYTKTFVFNNQADGLYLLVMDVITYIQQHAKINEAIQAKLKMILVELLTNALKHASQSDTILKVALTGDRINIQKTDFDSGLAISNGDKLWQWPLPGVHHAGNTITIYNHSNAVLKAKLHDNCNLQFLIEEREKTAQVNINNIAEHFGLMIITRSCDTFTYNFDIDTCSNNFIVAITV